MLRLMNTARKKKFESAGWKVGTASEFLGLSRQEAQIVEMKLALSESLKRRRRKRHLTQQALAKRLGSSQSRVANLKSGAAGRSLTFFFPPLFPTHPTPPPTPPHTP